jgi:hypothetical protein
MKFSIYLVATVAVLIALFVLFKPRETPSVAQVKDAAVPGVPAIVAPPPAAAPAQPATAMPSGTEASGATTAPPPAPAASAPPLPAPLVFDLSIRKNQLVAGPTVIKVHKNDEVIINLNADAADELHLHGYDLHIKMRPNETATLKFTANKTGRFGYELHHSKAELGALEVYPR